MSRFLRNQHGATMIEYAVICAVVVLILLAGLVLLGNKNTQNYTNVATQVSTHM